MRKWSGSARRWAREGIAKACGDPSAFVGYSSDIFGNHQGLFLSRSIRKSHPLWGHCCCSSKEDVVGAGKHHRTVQALALRWDGKNYCCMHHLCRFQSPPLFTSRVRVRCCRVNFPERCLSSFAFHLIFPQARSLCDCFLFLHMAVISIPHTLLVCPNA